MSKTHVFNEISADDDHGATEVESLCTECGENGVTRLLLTKIPQFKEVILSSFSCDHCSNSNNEIQSGGRIQDQGIVIRLEVVSKNDLDRQVVKSDWASFNGTCHRTGNSGQFAKGGRYHHRGHPPTYHHRAQPGPSGPEGFGPRRSGPNRGIRHQNREPSIRDSIETIPQKMPFYRKFESILAGNWNFS